LGAPEIANPVPLSAPFKTIALATEEGTAGAREEGTAGAREEGTAAAARDGRTEELVPIGKGNTDADADADKGKAGLVVGTVGGEGISFGNLRSMMGC